MGIIFGFSDNGVTLNVASLVLALLLNWCDDGKNPLGLAHCIEDTSGWFTELNLGPGGSKNGDIFEPAFPPPSLLLEFLDWIWGVSWDWTSKGLLLL